MAEEAGPLPAALELLPAPGHSHDHHVVWDATDGEPGAPSSLPAGRLVATDVTREPQHRVVAFGTRFPDRVDEDGEQNHRGGQEHDGGEAVGAVARPAEPDGAAVCAVPAAEGGGCVPTQTAVT